MKTRCWLFVAISLFAFSHLACAEDLTVSNAVSNAVYKDYRVIRSQPDAIVIKHSAGIATLYFWELSDDIQKQYNYDPVKAQEYNLKAKEQQAEWQAKLKEQYRLEQQKIDQANAFLAQQIEEAQKARSAPATPAPAMKPSLNAGAPTVVPAQEQLNYQQQLHTHGLN